jgi:hypothetical protein
MANFYPKAPICPRLLLIDGLGRAGKLLTAKLVSNLEHVECFQYSPVLEQFPVMHFLNRLSQDATVAFLRLMIDEFVYDRMVGRNLNTRVGDASCIVNTLDYDRYIRRGLDPEGDTAIDLFTRDGRIPTFMTHHAIPHFWLFLQAVPETRLIHVVRHPIDVVASWYTRFGGARFGTDRRILTLSMEGAAGPAPWWRADDAEAYAAMSGIDRCISDVIRLWTIADDAQERLGAEGRARVHGISYEGLAAAPLEVISDIAAFLGTEIPNGFNTILTREIRETLPDVVGARAEKKAEIEALGSRDLVSRLNEICMLYEAAWPDVRA